VRSQFHKRTPFRQRPKSIRQGKAIGCTSDNRTCGYLRFADNIAHEVEVYFACVRQFGPLCFKEFKAFARIHHEIHFAGSIPPKEKTTHTSGAALTVPELGENKRLPYCARGRRLQQSFFRTDIQLECLAAPPALSKLL
jgi:hypothetical protein